MKSPKHNDAQGRMSGLHSLKSVLFLFLVFFIFLFLPKIQFVELDHGDEFTDANVLIAGANFVRHGFVQCRFLPYFEVNSDLSEKAYTTFPPFAEVVNGLLRSLFQFESVLSFRIFSLCCSFFTLLFWYSAFHEFTQKKTLGLIFAVMFMTNPMFVYSADSLNQACFSETGRALFFFLFIVGPVSTVLKKHLQIILWSAFFLNSLISLEYVPYLAVFMASFSLLLPGHVSSLSFKSIFFLCSAPVVSLGMRMVQNAWYFGSFSAAIQNTLDAAHRRILSSNDSPIPLSFENWWNDVVLNNLQQVQVLRWEVWVFAGGLILLMALSTSSEEQVQTKKMVRLAGVFFLSGVTWYLFMPSHSLAHSQVLFLARHFIPLAVAGFTIFFQVCIAFSRENQLSKNIYRVLLFGWIATLFFVGLNSSQHPFNTEYRLRSNDFLLFRDYLFSAKKQFSTTDLLGVNYWRLPMISYYTQTKTLRVFDADSFLALDSKPSYFLLFPYQNRATIEFSETLKESYELVSRSPSLGFQVLLLKKKNLPEKAK